MEWLDICVDYRTPNGAQCTMWMVYEGQRKIPNEISVRQHQSSKIATSLSKSEDSERQIRLKKL
jgi:hypothetical protein